MSDWPMLSLVIFLPLVGAGVHPADPRRARGGGAERARRGAVDLGYHLPSVAADLGQFRPEPAAFQMVERARVVLGFNIDYHMGVDGISLLFVLLSDAPHAALHNQLLAVDPRSGSRST